MNRKIEFKALFTHILNNKSVWLNSTVNYTLKDMFGYCQKSPWLQYSGEKDYNKKDIYVGDILSEKWKAEVYQNDEGTFMVKFHNNPKVNKPMSLKKYLEKRKLAGCEERDCVIIGNIFETPEMAL